MTSRVKASLPKFDSAAFNVKNADLSKALIDTKTGDGSLKLDDPKVQQALQGSGLLSYSNLDPIALNNLFNSDSFKNANIDGKVTQINDLRANQTAFLNKMYAFDGMSLDKTLSDLLNANDSFTPVQREAVLRVFADNLDMRNLDLSNADFNAQMADMSEKVSTNTDLLTENQKLLKQIVDAKLPWYSKIWNAAGPWQKGGLVLAGLIAGAGSVVLVAAIGYMIVKFIWESIIQPALEWAGDALDGMIDQMVELAKLAAPLLEAAADAGGGLLDGIGDFFTSVGGYLVIGGVIVLAVVLYYWWRKKFGISNAGGGSGGGGGTTVNIGTTGPGDPNVVSDSAPYMDTPKL
jgi:hypothetical protein